MTFRILNIDQAEHDGAGSGGGAAGSQDGADGAGAGAAAAAGAGAAQAGADSNAASQKAGKDGTSQSSAEEQTEWEFDGQKVKYTRQQIIDELRKAKDYTQKTQEVAKTRKEQLARLARLDQIEAEYQALKKKAGANADKDGGNEDEKPDPIKNLEGRLNELHEKELQRDWKDAYNPVAMKYKNMDEARLIERFLEKKKLGEVEDTSAGLMKTAEEVAREIDTESETADNSRVDKLLSDPKNPKLEAFKQKVIADFVAGKIKLAAAGGDNGKGPAADAQKKEKRDISDVAADILASIK